MIMKSQCTCLSHPPPPEINIAASVRHVASNRVSKTTSMSSRKPSFFVSGVGIGEKCLYCCYNKLRAWSRRWFTHMFLTIVLLLYTVGGAVVFEVIEGQAETKVELDLKNARDGLLKELRLSAIHTPIEKSLEEWIGEASRKIQIQYEMRLESHYTTHKLAVINGVENKVWTFWNSVVFCATVYTSIVSTKMESAQPDENSQMDMAKIEAMVTPEQVHNASIAKKRRTFTKRKNRRDKTPMKEMETTDEEESRPKTPERRRRKKEGWKSEPEASETKEEQADLIFEKKESLAELAQAEVVHLFNKTRKGISAAASRGREKFKKLEKEQVKRSQSAPHAFTQEELIESFRRAQLLDEEKVTQFRPEVVHFVRERKKQRATSAKFVEVLNSKTPNRDFHLRHLFSVFGMYTLKELNSNFRIFKQDMRKECQIIKALRNKCFCQLFIIVIFCGLGGFLFKFIEGSFEYFYKCGVKRVKRDFIEMLWLKSHNLREEDWKSLARSKLRVFEEELHMAHEAGMKTYSGQKSWSFLNSVVYCLSIITTIGYGHIYPETKTGKALTIVYAIIGIPLFLLALTDFGKLFTRCIKFLWSFVRRLYYTGSCRKVRKQTHMKGIMKGAQAMYEIATFRRPSMFSEDHETPIETPQTPAISNFEIDDEFNLPISLAIFILLIYLFLGGLIYCFWEGWGFFDSFYFVFVSMSTIGFGDLVPKDPICMVVSIVYLVFGLALMSMCINVVQDKLSDTFKQASSKIGATIGIKVSEEDGSIATVSPEQIELPPIHD